MSMTHTSNYESFLRLTEVKARTGLSRSTIYLRIAEGTFPKPVRIGGRAVAWLSTEISEWIKNCVEQSRSVQG